jgi:hypothetical protein
LNGHPERNSCGVGSSPCHSLAAGVRGLKADQVKRLKELEAENARLRRAVSDLTLV